jgi:hypothetical protein
MDTENHMEGSAKMAAQETTGVATALSRRALLLNGAVAAAFAVLRPAMALAQAGATPLESGGIRPFRVDIPSAALVDLRRRLAATR